MNLFSRICTIAAVMALPAVLLSCSDDPIEDDPYIPSNEIDEPVPVPVPIPVQKRSVELLSGPVSDYMNGDTAHISIKTVPWDLLQTVPDSLYLADTLGVESSSCHVAGMELCPEDSTWRIGALLDSGDSSCVRLCISLEDTLLMTEPFTVRLLPDPVPEGSIRLVSGPVSAYYGSDTAVIRIKTVPWDMLQENPDTLFMTDTLGAEIPNCLLTGVEFSPEDSTWLIGARLKSGSSAAVRLCVDWNDSILTTAPVTVRKITDGMPTIRVDGRSLTRSGNSYSTVMPTVTDFSKMPLAVSTTWDSVMLGDVKLGKTAVDVDMSMPLELYAWKYDVCQKLTVQVRNTGLPVVRITTPKSVTSKTVWVTDCRIRIELPDGTVDLEDTLSVRGRGNNTWNFAKKPYALRMNGRTKVLDMPKHKRWILLANYKDRTLMRNDATFWLSKHSGLNYTIDGRFVELVLNGKHVGNYYLCEQAKIDKNRIAISEPDPLNAGSSGYLMEIDTYYDDDLAELKKTGVDTRYYGFRSGSFNLPYIFKQPDMEDMTQEAYNYLKNYINSFEAILKNDTKLKNHEYEKYLDVDQAIDYVLVEELAGNHDFYNTWPAAGPHSTYLYLDAAGEGKLCFGPGWDFDYHTYMPSRSSGWIGLTAHKEQQQGGWPWGGGWGGGWGNQNDDYYFYFLLKDPKFKKRLQERWNAQKGTFKQLTEYIDSMAVVLRDSEAANYAVWGAINNPNGDENEDQNLTFQNAINRMKDGFLKRWDWMDKNIPNL